VNRISCIIPAYNCERFVQRSLDSVLSQSRPPDELRFLPVMLRTFPSFGRKIRVQPRPATGESRRHQGILFVSRTRMTSGCRISSLLNWHAWKHILILISVSRIYATYGVRDWRTNGSSSRIIPWRTIPPGMSSRHCWHAGVPSTALEC
jgi:hypothetical protein